MKICKNFPYTSKIITQKLFEIKSCLVLFFYFPKMGKMVFDLKNGKTKFGGSFSFVLAFKQAEEHILFQVKPLKIKN